MVTIAYKLTTQSMTTFNDTRWKLGEWKRKPDTKTDLGTGNMFHCYTSPLLALLMNPIHAEIDNPRLFECSCSGLSSTDHGLKSGYKNMRLDKELFISITLTQRRAFAILIVLEVCKTPLFVKWANNWLNGTDRTANSAYAAAGVATGTATFAAAHAAHAAYTAHAAAAHAAHAAYAAYAAYAATYAADHIDFTAIAKKAMEY